MKLAPSTWLAAQELAVAQVLEHQSATKPHTVAELAWQVSPRFQAAPEEHELPIHCCAKTLLLCIWLAEKDVKLSKLLWHTSLSVT